MPELGKKFECAECGAKFYDLGKPDAICPRCGTNQRDVEKSAAPEPRPRYVAPKAAAPPVEHEDEPVEGIGDEDDEILEVEPGEEEEEEEEEEEDES